MYEMVQAMIWSKNSLAKRLPYHRTAGRIRKRTSTHRGERGLTTLEWLLIVAAVAGLAALAVVLVQNVVDDTAEEISGNNARVTAARVAADRINSDAIDEIVTTATTDGSTPPKYTATGLANINSEFNSKCARLSITYSDAEVEGSWTLVKPPSALTSAAFRADLEKQIADKTAGCKTNK